jgi:hypothetical protein
MQSLREPESAISPHMHEIVIDTETTGLDPFSAEGRGPTKRPQVEMCGKREQFCCGIQALSPTSFGSSVSEIALDAPAIMTMASALAD